MFLFVVATALALTANAADPLDTWTVRNPTPTPNDLRSVTTGNGLVVAVGTAGTIVTSADSGDTWTVQDSIPTDPSINFVGVAFGNGKFVALPESGSQQPIITSLNGTNWTTNSTFFAPVPTAFTAISFGGGTFVAVGYSGDTNLVYTSTDGVAWTRRSAGESNSVNAVTYAQNQFVAVGGTAFPTNRGFIITSPDGVTWTTRRSSVPALYSAVAGNATGFVAVGGRRTSRSANGTTWTDITDVGIGFASRNAVAASGSLFVAADTTRGISDSTAFNSSTDGAAWTVNGTLESISALTFANGRFYAVGTGNSPGYSPLGTRPALLFSDDGISWKRRSSGLKQGANGLKSPAINAAAFGNGRFVVMPIANFSNPTFTSTNGADWLGNPNAYIAGTANGVIFANGQFVAVGGDASVDYNFTATSADGTNWTTRLTGNRGPLSAVAFGNGLHVAVGRHPSNERPVFTSTDAALWNFQATGITNDLFGVAFGAGNFVAVGAAGTVARSADGSSWTTQSITSSNHLRGVGFAGGQFVAVGDWGAIFTSPNGATWTRRTSGTTLDLNVVTFFNGRYIAGGDAGKLLTSLDGIAWSAADSGTDLAILAMASGANRLLLVGSDSLLATSADGLTWIVRNLFPPVDALFREVVRVDDRIVALGSSQAFSATGRNWASLQTGGLVAGNGAVYTNGLLVAVGTEELGQATKISVSTNRGDTWTTTNLGTFGQLYGIVYANGQFVAVGDRSAGNAAIMTSTNGFTWTLRNSGAAFALWDIAYGNGLFVAVGASGGVRSTDGVTWTSTPGAAGETVTFGGGRFVKAGAGASVSIDGINWTGTLANTVSLENITHAFGTFVAVGPSGIYTSPDGTAWQNRLVRTLQKLNAVDFANDSFYVVGYSGTIYQSGYLTNTPATILQPPQSRTVVAGAATVLNANVTGRLPISFQWFKNGVPIPGGTDATLTIKPAAASDTGSYHVVAANEFGSQSSSPATLTIATIGVAVNPEYLYLFTGTTGSFTATVTGGTPTGYQWWLNSSPIAGGTNATLTFTNAQLANTLGLYSVTAFFPFGQSAATNSGSLQLVNSLDEIYLYYVNGFQSVPVGSTVEIAASLGGPTPLTYQWRKAGVIIAGATNALLVFTNAQTTNSADYSYSVTYTLGSITNLDASTLLVYSNAAPVLSRGQLLDANTLQLTFTGLVNRSYQIDYTTSLANPVVWSVYDAVSLTTNPLNYPISLSFLPPSPQYFFRVQILPP